MMLMNDPKNKAQPNPNMVSYCVYRTSRKFQVILCEPHLALGVLYKPYSLFPTSLLNIFILF